jgi:hypothetical protein
MNTRITDFDGVDNQIFHNATNSWSDKITFIARHDLVEFYGAAYALESRPCVLVVKSLFLHILRTLKYCTILS